MDEKGLKYYNRLNDNYIEMEEDYDEESTNGWIIFYRNFEQFFD